MKRADKETSVAELKERLEHYPIAVMSKYIGITAGQSNALRLKLRQEGVTFKVYKNTLAKRVLDELGYSEAAQYLDGPIAWAFSEDPVAPPKALKEYGKTVPQVAIHGGILEGQVVSKEQLEALADLPPREVLLAQVAGTMAAPLRNFVGVLNAVPRNLVNVLDQVRKQKEENEQAA